MKPSLFITGAGGFVGSHLLAQLEPSKYQTIYCLILAGETVQLPEPDPGNIKVITGDLLDVSTYEGFLEKVDTVIHMAALTGKFKPQAYIKVNAYGTMLLLDRCKQAGVKNFLFISSIAVTFKNKHRYFYAHSKEQAETYVKNSGLHYTILRPTMIMGKGAPVFEGFSQLAGLPIIPVFGKGKNRIQPIYAADMAGVICRVEETSRYHGEVLEAGGPEVLSTKDFLKKVARCRGKKKPRTFRLPVGLIAFSLSILERVVYNLLPLTVGQLASFRNDGIAEPNPITTELAPRMKGIDEIIQKSLEGEMEEAPPPGMSKSLIKECRTFCKYLVKKKPNHYVMGKYDQCNEKLSFQPEDFHDALLLKLAAARPLFTRMTDAYSRFFRSNSIVRKKLAYLVGILEVSPPYFHFYDSSDGSGKLGFLIKAGLKGTGMALHLLISFLFLFPLQLLAKIFSRKQETQEV